MGAGLYDKVGHGVRRADAAGLAARQLRRTWRVLLDGTGQQGTPAAELPPNCLDTSSSWPATKRARNCGKLHVVATINGGRGAAPACCCCCACCSSCFWERQVWGCSLFQGGCGTWHSI